MQLSARLFDILSYMVTFAKQTRDLCFQFQTASQGAYDQ